MELVTKTGTQWILKGPVMFHLKLVKATCQLVNWRTLWFYKPISDTVTVILLKWIGVKFLKRS